MGQFDFTSPGAAFGDAITQALVERKANQRQQLIDTLGVKAEQRAEQEAESMRNYRDFEIKSGQQRNELEMLKALTEHMIPGDDPEALGHSPEQIKLGNKYGIYHQEQIPDTTAVTSATDSTAPPKMKTKYTYAGTGQQQTLEQMKKETKEAIMAMPDPEGRQQLLHVAAANGGLLPEPYQAALFGNKPVYGYDATNQTLTRAGSTPWNAIIENKQPPLPRSPRVLNPIEHWNPETQSTEYYDAEDMHLLKSIKGMGQHISAGTSNPRDYTAGGHKDYLALGIPQQIIDRITAGIVPELESWDGQGDVSPTVASYRAIAFGAIGNSRASAAAKAEAQAFISDPNTPSTTQLSKADAEDLQSLLLAIGITPGSKIAQALATKPIKLRVQTPSSKPATLDSVGPGSVPDWFPGNPKMNEGQVKTEPWKPNPSAANPGVTVGPQATPKSMNAGKPEPPSVSDMEKSIMRLLLGPGRQPTQNTSLPDPVKPQKVMSVQKLFEQANQAKVDPTELQKTLAAQGWTFVQ